MLRITVVACEGRTARLLVEGRLTRETVGELERECNSYLSRHQPVRLDLSELTFADETGANALLRLERKGVVLGERSTFVAWLLETPAESRDE
jgi:ABC-type transporter Mla MlaB component